MRANRGLYREVFLPQKVFPEPIVCGIDRVSRIILRAWQGLIDV